MSGPTDLQTIQILLVKQEQLEKALENLVYAAEQIEIHWEHNLSTYAQELAAEVEEAKKTLKATK